jgi:A/G-specific adenine glycosylase
VRGLLLAVLREHTDPVPVARLDAVWPDAVQRQRALATLIDDGLVVQPLPGRFALPSEPHQSHLSR